jgi:hypothetical protein
MEHGYSGIVNISPFACLIGRVIEGIFTPWARERNYPTLSVEVDGNLLPPNIVNKLNIFMVNVLRFKGGNDLSGLVDKAGSHTKRFTATGGAAPAAASAIKAGAAALGAGGECAVGGAVNVEKETVGAEAEKG